MLGTRIVLVRHGHSMAQEDGVAGGHAGCRGLSDMGRTQVGQLADRLRRTGELDDVAALYSSVMPRAVQTADLLADALGQPPRDRDCDLCEFHIGEEADGLPWSQIQDRWPAPTDVATEDEHYRRTPTTESWHEMTQRVERGLRRLVDRHAGHTVVVATHGGVVANVMMQMLKLSARPTHDERAYVNPANTSLTEFVNEPVEWLPAATSPWRLERYNDHAHLAGTA